MTKNKLDDSIRSNMLDELLSDVDKPKPPEPKRTNYSGQSGFDWGNGDDMPRSFLDDDGPDPMDAGYSNYHGFSGNRGGYSAPPVRKHDSVFNRRTTHENVVPTAAYDEWDRKVADVVRTLSRVNGQLVLERGELDELTGILMKMIGVQLDKVGIVWGTEGLKAFKEMLKDLIPMSYYGTTKFVMDDDDFEDGRFGKTTNGTVYDRETGEVIGEEEDLEERLAIMEENAGHE